MIPVHFGNPAALLLLLCAIPAALWARKSMAGLGRERGAAALALRLTIVALIALALAKTQWSRARDDMAVMFVLDRSRSIPEDAAEGALRFVSTAQEKRKREDTVGLVVFGRNAALERRPLRDALLREPDGKESFTLQSVVQPDRTDLSAALRLALAAFPPSSRRRIVLISDGNENMGSSAEEVEAARRNGVRVDARPVTYDYPSEVLVEKVVAPAEVDRRASYEVRVVVLAHRRQTGALRLTENGALIGSQTVDLKEGRNVFVVQRRIEEPGYYSYTATIEAPEDTLYANNTAGAFTLVRGRGRVLYVEGSPAHGQPLAQALKSEGLDVKMIGLESLPLGLGEIIPHDALILSDVAAASLGEAGMRAVELAVKEWGVGLIMVGGENSFGPGGYQDSPIERALPVSMEVRQRRVMPAGALVVILHTCEIPQGNYWAQQIALAALRVLGPNDEYGILYYSWNPGGVNWLFDLQPCAKKDVMAALINGVQPGDMPDFASAFKQAHAALQKSTASMKHAVVISDGDPSYPSDAEVLAMVADGITISAVGISPHSANDTARLAHIANIGRGRYYEPTHPAELPQIFIKEAATVRRSLISEEPFAPKLAMMSEMIRGLHAGAWPPLRGHVLASPKPLAETPLVTPDEDPLLAHWQYGLGRAVAFTSDAKPRWAADWIGWERYAQFWAQAARWAARNVRDAGLRAHAEIKDDRARLLLDALDKEGRFLNGLQFTGTLVTPEKQEVALKVEQTGPGRYESVFDGSEPGTHFISLRYTDADGKPALHTSGLVVPYSGEYRELKANETRLRRIAEATGGRVLTDGDDVFARTFEPEPVYADMWPLLLLIAVLLFPADVFVRRVFVDYGAVWARIAPAFAWVPVLGRRYRRETAPTHVSALLSRKRATREELDRRGRKFEAAPPTGPAPEGAAAAEALQPPPRIEVRERPQAGDAGPAIRREDETYTGRLLRAKKRLREDDEKQNSEKT